MPGCLRGRGKPTLPAAVVANNRENPSGRVCIAAIDSLCRLYIPATTIYRRHTIGSVIWRHCLTYGVNMDALFVGLIVLFAALSLAMIAGCARLQEEKK